MFFDNDKDSENMQRFKNMAFFKVPVTNETRDAAMPAFVVITVLVLIVCGIVATVKALS